MINWIYNPALPGYAYDAVAVVIAATVFMAVIVAWEAWKCRQH